MSNAIRYTPNKRLGHSPFYQHDIRYCSDAKFSEVTLGKMFTENLSSLTRSGTSYSTMLIIRNRISQASLLYYMCSLSPIISFCGIEFWLGRHRIRKNGNNINHVYFRILCRMSDTPPVTLFPTCKF